MSTHDLGSLELLHEALRRDGFSGDLVALVHLIGRTGFVDAEWALKELLVSKDENLRRAALSVLALEWACKDQRQACERLAFVDPDPDEEVRRTAVAGLGVLLEGTRDTDALKLLLPMVQDEKTRVDFRDTAYAAMTMIMGKKLGPIWEELDWSKDIDWNLIEEAKAIAGT